MFTQQIQFELNMAQKLPRIKKEMSTLQLNPPEGISCWFKDGNDFTHLKAVIAGLIGTPYQGGKFDIEITIPERYPFEAPGVRFTTPVYHPNIDNRGRICMDLLKSQPTGTWKPTIHLSHLLISVQLLLSEPNPNDPLMPEIAEEFLKNREKFNATARSWTAEHATKRRHLEKGLEEPDSKRRKV